MSARIFTSIQGYNLQIVADLLLIFHLAFIRFFFLIHSMISLFDSDQNSMKVKVKLFFSHPQDISEQTENYSKLCLKPQQCFSFRFLKDTFKLTSNILWQSAFFIMPLSFTKFPVPFAEKHIQSMIISFSCFLVDTISLT